MYDPKEQEKSTYQGFITPVSSIGRKVRKPKANKPIVACDKCGDWHRKGEHIKPVEEIVTCRKCGTNGDHYCPADVARD